MSRDTLYTWDQSTNKGFLGWEMTSTICGQMGVFFAMLSFLFWSEIFLKRLRRLVLCRIYIHTHTQTSDNLRSAVLVISI